MRHEDRRLRLRLPGEREPIIPLTGERRERVLITAKWLLIIAVMLGLLAVGLRGCTN